MWPGWLGRMQLPRSLRRQFVIALSTLALLVVAGGGTAIYALHTSTAATRQLAEERLVHLQQAQDLVQNTLLIERDVQRLLSARGPGEMRSNHGNLLAHLQIHDQLVDALAAASEDTLVLDVQTSGQLLRNTANVVAQLMEGQLQTAQAFAQAMQAWTGQLQDANDSGMRAMAALLYRLQEAEGQDKVEDLLTIYRKQAAAIHGLPAGLASALPAASGNPFALRLDLIAQRHDLTQFGEALQGQVVAMLASSQRLSERLTLDYRNAIQSLADSARQNLRWVVTLLSGSLLLAWLVARYFLGKHVLVRLQLVSQFLHQGDSGPGPAVVPVGGRDEIGEMARAVEQFLDARRQLAEAHSALLVEKQRQEALLEKLEVAYRDLDDAKTGLEVKVGERTEALREANRQLEIELAERKRTELELARANRSLRMLSDSNQSLIHVADQSSLLDKVCRTVVEVGGYRMAWVGFASLGDPIKIWPVAHAGGTAADLLACHLAWPADGAGDHPAINAIRSGKACLGGNPEAAREGGGAPLRYALPLVNRGEVFGVLCVEASGADAFSERETVILDELAGDLAFGILTLQARDEHDRAEAALVRSERYLRSVYENSPLAYQSLDDAGNFVEVNPAWCAMLKLDREQVIGREFSAFLAPGSTEKLQETIARFKHQGEIHGAEFEMVRADGSQLEVELDCKAAYDENGNFRQAHCILHDITQRKIVERAMMHHAAIVESSNDAIISKSLDGIITSWNDSAERMFGYRRDEVVGRHIALLIPGAHRKEEDLILDKIRQGLAVKHYQTVRRRKDGGLINVSVTISPLRDASGKIVGASKIARDITDVKRAEQELRLAATAFESQEGMLITDSERVILRVNQAFTEITGYATEEVVGQRASLLKSNRHDPQFYESMLQTVARDGAWQGEIWNRHKDGRCYPAWLTITAVKGEEGAVTHYVGTLTDITRRKQAEEEIRELAFYDQLTRLPNRRLLMDRLQQALAASSRSGREGVLLFIDLDNFKTLNDTFGHDHGDLLLQEVARRLGTCVRDGDTVARLGGDEFVVMLEDLSANPQEAASLAKGVSEKILAVLNVPYLLAGREHHSTPSIGVTLFVDSRSGIDDLLKQADIAMYQAKSAGRNTVRFFDPEMQTALNARASLEADLRRGLAERQLILYYQPQVDRNGRMTGAEALVRWHHPARGIVSPAAFIPLAEESGLIVPLGQWVLETACAQLVAWQARQETAGLTLAVNVSARQFRQAEFVDQVCNTLRLSGADPHKLELELTESVLLDDVEATIVKMTALKGEGVRFSLDDFGTGYSSLAYLKRLPLDQLKIDQSFVNDVLSDPNDAAIARTVVALGRSLGLSVIAEGVESEAQRAFLAGQGCFAYQGYLFGRPVPIDQFNKLEGLAAG